MDPHLFRNIDPGGALLYFGAMSVILIGVAANLLGSRWDDWLDERWGRGSIPDWWLLRRRENGNGNGNGNGKPA